jgi:hypothetical protein
MPEAQRMYMIVVYRPLPAAPLVVRCMYMVVVPGPMPAAVASRSWRRRFQQLACACGSSCQNRCLRPLLRGVVDAGFNIWLAPRLTCGSMLEVSRDAVAAEEEQLVSCTADQSNYCSICTVTLDPMR